MKCPACNYIASNKKDICPRCLVDLRPHKAALGLPIFYPHLSADQLRAMANVSELAAEDLTPPVTTELEINSESSADSPRDSKPGLGGLWRKLFERKPVTPVAVENLSPSAVPSNEQSNLQSTVHLPAPESVCDSPPSTEQPIFSDPPIATLAAHSPSDYRNNKSAEPAISEQAHWASPITTQVAPQVLEFHDDEELLERQLSALLGAHDEELTVEAVPSHQGSHKRASVVDGLSELDLNIEIDLDEEDVDAELKDESIAPEEESAKATGVDEAALAQSSLLSAIDLVSEAKESTEILASILAEPTVEDDGSNGWLSARAEHLVTELAMECALPKEELLNWLQRKLDPNFPGAETQVDSKIDVTPVDASNDIESSVGEVALEALLHQALDAVGHDPDDNLDSPATKEALPTPELWREAILELTALRNHQAEIDLGAIVNFDADRAKINVLFQLTEDELNGKVSAWANVDQQIRSEHRKINAVALNQAIEKIQQEVAALDGDWEYSNAKDASSKHWHVADLTAFTPAPIWQRFAAKCIDSIIVAALAGAYTYWTLPTTEIVDYVSTIPGITVVVSNFLLCLFVASTIITTALVFTSGQTWGKKLLGICVISKSGEPLSLWQSIIRAAAGPLHLTTLGCTTLSIIGSKRRTIVDLLAHSWVVQYSDPTAD